MSTAAPLSCVPAGQGAVLGFPVEPAMRHLIDAALNAVMEDAAAQARLTMGTLGRCADYALVGARVLRLLLNRPYTALSGGEIIDCGGGLYVALHPGRKARRSARKLSELKDYHCWIEALHPMPDGTVRREVIDFTARHDPLVASVCGLPFAREHVSNYLWAWHEDIAPLPLAARAQLPPQSRSGDWMWTDRDCLRLLKRYEQDHDGLLDHLTGQVLHKLVEAMQAHEDAASGHRTSPPESSLGTPDSVPLAVAQPSRAGLKAAASTPKRAICEGTASPRIRAAYVSPAAGADWMP
ncbi:hypothetical protein HBDW_12380 [Herbaspirillum sp. DW155]|nr:hypothetical protein HBDW_12380 [Herbaspirillum sp. DW155]